MARPHPETISPTAHSTVRGKVHIHFDSASDAEDALAASGLTGVLHDPNDFAF